MTSVRKEHKTIGIMILIRKKCKYGYHGKFGIIKKIEFVFVIINMILEDD
jgi:hypothetical protein